MSIIHDALKKVQLNLSSKKGKIPSSLPIKAQETSSNPFTTPIVDEPTSAPTPTLMDLIKNILIILGSIGIIAGSFWYIYQQYHDQLPRVERFAQKSVNTLLQKKDIPDFKTKAPSELKSLAQLTINPSEKTSSSLKASPITLNIHGIMSNVNGNLVLINNQVYQEGDEVDGAKILKINLNSITVINNSKIQTIFVKD